MNTPKIIPFPLQQNGYCELSAIRKKSGLMLFHTDTILGVSVLADDKKAVEKLVMLKERPKSKGWLIISDSFYRLHGWLTDEMSVFFHQFEQCRRKPLTIILPSKHPALSWLNPKGTDLAVRVTQHALTKELVRFFACPIVSTSANPINCKTPEHWQQLSSDFLSKVDLIFEQPITRTQTMASTIVRYQKPQELVIIRQGSYGAKELRDDLSGSWKITTK